MQRTVIIWMRDRSPEERHKGAEPAEAACTQQVGRRWHWQIDKKKEKRRESECAMNEFIEQLSIIQLVVVIHYLLDNGSNSADSSV